MSGVYSLRRLIPSVGTTDADAHNAGEGLELPTAGSSGALGQGPIYCLRLYSYQVDLDIITPTVGGATFVSPTLCWVNTAGTYITAIEADNFIAPLSAAADQYHHWTFSHDYGPDGRQVYRPQLDATSDVTRYLLGLVVRLGIGVSTMQGILRITYGIDLDYRKFKGNVPSAYQG